MNARRAKRSPGAVTRSPTAAPRARTTRSRQRQRLIDACISALHLYGPSRTTVEKVVAIAKMSPGIVRFYFDSKAAMLVASLQFLAAEFDEQLLVPVAKLRATPVAALERLVDLYLDPDIASPRKVSVWYAFWGEASSRQEYYDICGQKDESFAALVRELIERLIIRGGRRQLDPDGIALGLIGALEMLWQDFAFRDERDIDRAAAKERCMAYLRSVFPGEFPAARTAPRAAARGAAGGAWATSVAAAAGGAGIADPRPAWAGSAYADTRLHALERERLFRAAWTVVGHESQLPQPGDFITLDIATEQVLLVRTAGGAVRALRNCCTVSPHKLVADRGGRFTGAIPCRTHGLEFSPDGKAAPGRPNLTVLAMASVQGLMLVRTADSPPAVEAASAAGPALADPASRPAGQPGPALWLDDGQSLGLAALSPPREAFVRADWKVIVEQWLDAPECGVPRLAAADCLEWDVPMAGGGGWSARRYANLLSCVPGTLATPGTPGTPGTPERAWRRRFVAPNQLIETRPDGRSVMQAIPVAAGACLVRRLDFSTLAPDDAARAVLYVAHRLGGQLRRATLDVAESIQTGRVEFGYESWGPGNAGARDWFRNLLAARLPALAPGPLPSDNRCPDNGAPDDGPPD